MGDWYEEAWAERPAAPVPEREPYKPVVELAVGNRGFGKTWQIRRRATELLASGATGVYAHDPWGAYPYEELDLGARGEGWAVLNGPDEWGGEAVASFRRAPPEEVADFCRSRPGSVLVVDELDLICRANKWNSEAARDIVHYGRHLKISILGSARRFSNVHQDVLSLADRIYLHRLTWDRDLDRVEENWGRGVRDIVSHLPKPPAARRHFLVVPDDVEQDEPLDGDVDLEDDVPEAS